MVLNRELHEVELELAPLFLSPKRSNSTFIHVLSDLIRKKPVILDFALQVKPEDGSHSFVIILFQKVFHYCLLYQHKAYNPYYPTSEEELEKVAQILKLHFPDLASRLVIAFHKLSGLHTKSSDEILKSSGRANLIDEENKAAQKLENKPKKPVMSMEMDDMPVHEEVLINLWQKNHGTSKYVSWPDSFRHQFPTWATGIIDSMVVSNYLYLGFLKQESRFFVVHTGERIRPWHRTIRMIIAAEYYWNFNRRCVDIGAGMNMLDASRMQQEHIYRVYEEFMRLLPEEHEAVQEINRRNWKADRIKGTMQSPRVQLRYLDPVKNYNIEVSNTTLTAKEIRLAKQASTQTLDEIKKAETDKEKTPVAKQVKVVEYKDPGIKEDILWTLYMAQKMVPEWNKDFTHQEEFSSWARGLLSGMKATYTLYDYFQKTANRSKAMNAGVNLQPHHRIVRVLIAAEYFWLFNARDTSLPEELGIAGAREMFQKHVSKIYEHFVELLPDSHPARISEDAMIAQAAWKVERLRGTKRANKVSIKYTDDEGSWMVEFGSTSISAKRWDEGDE
ncbi:MAG: hypothetical protein H3C47_11540 [Candidatus Cloacimonetes bacterium]|nr:hypothetical protein [Candidatus Cloacimonadota bacterium]